MSFITSHTSLSARDRSCSIVKPDLQAPRGRRGRLGWAAGAVVASIFSLNGVTHAATFDVVEKSISDIQAGYLGGTLTVPQVVQAYLDRIQQFDSKTGPAKFPVNSVAQVSPTALADAAAVQALIAGGATTAQYPMLGVPVLVKNSYDAKGLVTSNGVSVLNGAGTAGSSTFTAPNDAFSVKRLRDAGAIILGKASMSTMAYSYNGIDNSAGVVLNPYQGKRAPGGSSSGSGASIAANFAMIAMGGETGGSIRVPANHNALVGLKTSAGLVDPGGTWPLTPSRDVAGPLAKTVKDVAITMNALVAPSSSNLWNTTPFYSGAAPGTVRPADYTSFLSPTALQGKVIAVPKSMYNLPGKNYEGNIHPLVLTAFNNALTDIKAQGAKVIFVDIPAADTYYTTLGRPGSAGGATTTGFPYAYPTTTVGGSTPDNNWSSWAASYYYNELIKSYNDPTITNIRQFATALENGVLGSAGELRSTLGSRNVNPTTGAVTWTGAAGNIRTLAAIWEAGNAKGFGDANNDSIPDNPQAQQALAAFNSLRMAQYEGFMNNPNLVDDPSTPDVNESTIAKIDAFVAPTYGDRSPIQTSIVPNGTTDPYTVLGPTGTALSYASLLGRFESNILGAPAISVPMGYLSDGTPMGVQFFNEFLGDGPLLGYAYDYEQATLYRRAPDLLALTVPEPTSMLVLSGVTLVALRRRRTV
jgi:amidase